MFFGKSGLGKSSILRAGVSPLLRDSEFVPVYIRLNHAEEARCHSRTRSRFVSSRFSCRNKSKRPSRFAPEHSLGEYFHKKDC